MQLFVFRMFAAVQCGFCSKVAMVYRANATPGTGVMRRRVRCSAGNPRRPCKSAVLPSG